MRTVILGGAGFLGSHLCDAFLEKGHKVVAVDNFVTGCRANIEHLMTNSDFTLIEGDICHPLNIDGAVDYILNFASPASPKAFKTLALEILAVGSTGHRNALELAKAKNARILFASTSEVYGDPLVHPQSESYFGNVNCVGLRGCYDESKRFGEALTRAYHRTYQLETRIVRIFNTYGPRMARADGRALPNFISQALAGEPVTVYGDGSQTRSFAYVSDFVDGVYKLLFSDCSEPVNLGNPDEISILSVAQEVIAATGSKSEIQYFPSPPGDPKVRCPVIQKATELLDWTPKVQRAEGLRRTIQSFRARLA